MTTNIPQKAKAKAIGEVLIPAARTQQGVILPESEALALALELYWTALAMKPAYQQAGSVVARRFAERMGLDSQDVEAFAIYKLEAEVAKQEDHTDD